MTCIISFSTRRFAVQVSDRRVSPAEPGDQANRAIVFLAPDGVLSVGYTGAAHVGDSPADVWLAELLWGARTQAAGAGVAGQAATTCVADAVYRIRRALDGRVDLSKDFEILVSGFRRKAGRWLPVNLRVRRAPGGPAKALGRLMLSGRHVVVAAVGSRPTVPELSAAVQRIASRANGAITADESAALLIGLVRTVAARDPGVSTDLMTTIVQPPQDGPIVCRFSSLHHGGRIVLQKPGALSLCTPDLGVLGPVECSPWVIGQTAIMNPAPFLGGAGPKLWGEGYAVVVESSRPAPLTTKGVLVAGPNQGAVSP